MPFCQGDGQRGSPSARTKDRNPHRAKADLRFKLVAPNLCQTDKPRLTIAVFDRQPTVAYWWSSDFQ